MAGMGYSAQSKKPQRKKTDPGLTSDAKEGKRDELLAGKQGKLKAAGRSPGRELG